MLEKLGSQYAQVGRGRSGLMLVGGALNEIGEVCCLSHFAFGLHNVIYEVL